MWLGGEGLREDAPPMLLIACMSLLVVPLDFESASLGLLSLLLLSLRASLGDGIEGAGSSKSDGRKDWLPFSSSRRRKAVTAVHPECILPSDSSESLDKFMSTSWNV